jgi:hypothetical protein
MCDICNLIDGIRFYPEERQIRDPTLAMGKPDHQDIPVHRAIIVAIYLMLFAGFILLLPSVKTVGWLGEEDGPIENAGALSFLLAGTVFLVTAHRSSGLHRPSGTNHIESPLALLALGALCLICFGEEISWGQRLFHYPVPAWLADINRQGEWNLHNLAWFHTWTTEGAKKSFWARLISLDRLLALFQLSLCTLVPMLTAYSTTLRTWGARIGLPIVPWWIAGLVPAHILITQVLYAIAAESPIVDLTLTELKETGRACIFLVVAAWAYNRTTATPSVSAGARPHDAVGP